MKRIVTFDETCISVRPRPSHRHERPPTHIQAKSFHKEIYVYGLL